MSNILSQKSSQDKSKGKNKKKGGYLKVENEDSMSKSEPYDIERDNDNKNNNLEIYDEKSKSDFEITSKWNSQMFEVKPQTPKENEFKLSEYFNEFIDRRTRILVIPTFFIVAIGSIIIMIIYFIGQIDGIVGMLTIAAFTWFGAIVGIIGVYRWGSVENAIDYFKDKNNEYENELDTLKDTKSAVKTQAKAIHFSVGKLKTHGEELEKNLEAFDELRQDLEKICGKNEDLQRMLDEINKQYDDWQEMIFENEKAHLMSIYFDTSLRDGEHGLTRQEYKRFLARLNKKTRKEFEQQGGFDMMDKDGNGKVDLHEFQHMLDMVIESVNQDEQQFIKQRSTLPSGYT